MDPLLSIRDLTVSVGKVTILDGVSFDVPQGKIVGIVGGSGSGKTTAGFSILQLLNPALTIRSGSVMFEGKDLLSVPPSKMRQFRGGQIAMIFQEPLDAFDPLFTIGQQIDEALATHTKLSPPQRHQKALEVLVQVQLPDVERMYRSYPHQLSGGQRQRAMIAQAIACGPKLLIADEPTGNLDVMAQAGIMDVFRTLRSKLNMAIMLITHDLGMVAHVADEVVVLCEGKVVETGPARQLIASPKHPYTQAMVEVFR